jgi:fatty acid-binding protein DegV
VRPLARDAYGDCVDDGVVRISEGACELLAPIVVAHLTDLVRRGDVSLAAYFVATHVPARVLFELAAQWAVPTTRTRGRRSSS